MPLAFRLNTKVSLFLFLGAIGVWAQMPPGPGREETQRVCSGCHELERSISLRQDRDGWKATINKMVSLGAEGTEQEFSAALDYLSQHYPAGDCALNMRYRARYRLREPLDLKRESLRRSSSIAPNTETSSRSTI